ncbi:general secretion pathway protein A [Geobacillus thermoleovorans]|uniref:General secretion pathway protein A n=2 Tax=Geobacillus thermoleovorans group TaxID=1505648 RepID=A0AA91TE11_9BACL|nr:general secretion pathway protein A [Geobacillus thermoleovorans]OQP09176.1 general secretion pathway protein A [Geobacillus thermoleovorans]OXB88795.1 general secretion pathway protein A [Geobacillus thermocatenulatus]RAN22285.1 General secretion pathway protein A [Geobacillus sp. A8]RXS86107.1 general secretion pathway protein A [Geobacillus sp. PK12]
MSTKGAESASFVLSLFHHSIRRAGNLHLKERANVPKECAKSGIIGKNFAHYFGIHLK